MGSAINSDDRHLKICCLVILTLIYEKLSRAQQDIIFILLFPVSTVICSSLSQNSLQVPYAAPYSKPQTLGFSIEDHGIIYDLDLNIKELWGFYL